MESEQKKKIIGGVAILAIVVALATMVPWGRMFGGSKTVVQTAQQDWKCYNTKCNATYKYTPEQINAIQEAPDKIKYGSERHPRELVIKCEKCGQFSVLAVK